MSNMELIKNKIEAYKSSLDQIQENRNLWSNTTKKLVYDTLMEIKTTSGLDLQVQKVDMLKNLEAVNIHFNRQASGFTETNGNSITNHIKHGGALIFSQAYNGQIFVIYSYPFIEGWVSQLVNKAVAKVLPSNINEEFIFREVEKFLDEMNNWETSNMSSRRGFDVNNYK